MFCEKCGTKHDDDAVFCSVCGHRVKDAVVGTQMPQNVTTPVQNVYQQPYVRQAHMGGQPPYYYPSRGVTNVQQMGVQQTAGVGQPTQNMSAETTSVENLLEHPVPKVIKEFAKSPIFLVTTIVFSVYLLLGFLPVMVSARDSYNEFGDYMYANELPGILIVGLLLATPIILTVIALWNLFGSARSKEKVISTSGVGLLKAAGLINLIFFCIAGVILTITVLFAFLETSLYSDEDAIAFFAVSLLVAYVILIIIGLGKIGGALNGVIVALRTGVVSNNVSLFAVVTCYINAVVRILFFMLVAMGEEFLMTDNECAMLACGIVSGIAWIFAAILLSILRSKLNEAKKYCEENNIRPYSAARIF